MNAFKRKPCIIPEDGFYEWKKTYSGKKPMMITLKTREPFGMTDLFDTWKDLMDPKCILARSSQLSRMIDIHDRMPVILRPEDEEIC
jgi:putative SOS response-associated peptidase YedK